MAAKLSEAKYNQRIAILTRLYLEGKTFKEMGKAIGVSAQRVLQILQANPNYGWLALERPLALERECDACGRTVRSPKNRRRFCHRDCANTWWAAEYRRQKKERANAKAGA